VHHVGILYDQFMMHGQRNIKLLAEALSSMQMVRQQELLRLQHLPESYDYRISMKI